jgi:tetratricopeptide (TPR) repeat protein
MRLVLCFTLLAIWSGQADDNPRAWSDLLLHGRSLLDSGNYSAAAAVFCKALAIAERSGINDGQLAQLHDALASAYAEAGQFAESEGEYRRALALLEKTEGRGSLNYAVVVASMAVLPTETSAPGPVVALLRQALAVNRTSRAIDSLNLVRGCLALILDKQKRYREEEALLLEALADLAKQKTSNPRLMGGFLNDLAMLRLYQKRYEESMDLQQKSIRLLEAAMGTEHPSLVVPFNNLGTTYVRMGRLDDAGLAYRRAIGLCGKGLGEDHLDYALILQNYSVVLRKLGDKRQAKKLQTQGRRIERAADRRNGIGSTISITALRSDKD